MNIAVSGNLKNMVANTLGRYSSVVLAVILSWGNGYAADFGVKVKPEYIDCGDTVIISYCPDNLDDEVLFRVITPSSKRYEFEPVRRNDRYELIFHETFDRGFLKKDWDLYRVMIVNVRGACIDSGHFKLNAKNRRLFFTVYVDDIGKAGFLQEQGEAWYKSIGGKINYGYQHDDWGGVRLHKILDRYDTSGDYIFHHFHAWEFGGWRLILSLDHAMDWGTRKEFFNNIAKVDLRDRHYALIFLAMCAGAIFVLFLRGAVVTTIVSICVLLFGGLGLAAILVSHNVNNYDNWELKLGEPHWCKDFLIMAKQEFASNLQPYPHLTRHGWNVPPAGLNEFYIKRIGVLADASLIFPNTAKFDVLHIDEDYGPLINRVKEYDCEWNKDIPLPLPYYTNIEGEFNKLWDGVEAHRGILEIPVVLSNLVGYGIDANDKSIIDALPDGALVSTYVHPADDLRALQETIEYVAQHSDIIFTSAEDYLDLYVSHFPRPVWIDIVTGQSSWAYWDNDNVYTITPCNAVQMDSGAVQITTETLPPYVILSGDGVNVKDMKNNYDLDTIIGTDTRVYRRRRCAS